MLGHKTSLNKLKMSKITPSIFSNHNGIKLEINNRKKTNLLSSFLFSIVLKILDRATKEVVKTCKLEISKTISYHVIWYRKN